MVVGGSDRERPKRLRKHSSGYALTRAHMVRRSLKLSKAMAEGDPRVEIRLKGADKGRKRSTSVLSENQQSSAGLVISAWRA